MFGVLSELNVSLLPRFIKYSPIVSLLSVFEFRAVIKTSQWTVLCDRVGVKVVESKKEKNNREKEEKSNVNFT